MSKHAPPVDKLIYLELKKVPYAWHLLWNGEVFMKYGSKAQAHHAAYVAAKTLQKLGLLVHVVGWADSKRPSPNSGGRG